jgi:hypothetical protein
VEYSVSGKKGWLLQGTTPASDFEVPEPLPVTRHWHTILAQLLLLRDKDFQLTSLRDETKDGRRFAGFRAVSSQGGGDFYFDKATGLLARAHLPMPNFPSLKAGQERMAEHLCEDYRDIQGVQYPMKFIVSAGKAYSLTITLSSIEFLDKIEAGLFDKPQTPVAKTGLETKRSREDGEGRKEGEETPVNRDRWLIVASVSAGVVVGVL